LPAPLSGGEQSDIGIKNVAISSPKPLDLAPFLNCNICKGVLVSATTITNCLHSFCKSCLVKQMLNKERALYHCPTCGSSIGGFKGIREDCQLQQIVNKVVPKLENLEAGRRKAFYEGYYKEDEGILENVEKVGQRGEDVNINEEFIGGNIDSNLEEGTCENNNKLPEGYGAVPMEIDRSSVSGMEKKQEDDQRQGPGFGEEGAEEKEPILNDHGQEGSGGNEVGVEAVQAGNGRENMRGKREKHVAEAKKAVEALLSEYSLRILEEVFLEIKEVAKGVRNVTLGEEGRKEASNRINYDIQEGQAINNRAGEIPKEKGKCMEDDCQKKFVTEKDLVRHADLVNLKTGPFSSKEDSCQVKFKYKEVIKGHVDEVHLKKRPFSCKEDGCEQKFGQGGDLEKHVDEVQLKRRLFSCGEDGCQAKFVSKRNMEGHVDQVHLKKRPFSCTYDGCQLKFGQKGNLAAHVDKVHLKKRPFPCTYDGCQQKFGQKRTLAAHVEQVHLKKRPFSCTYDGCQQKFGQKRNLAVHVDQVHLKKRSFTCNEDGCDKMFARKKTLVTHIDTVHLRKRPFSCKEDGCNRTFGQKGQLNVHVNQVHLKRKRFECSLCSKTFGIRQNLLTHIKLVHRKEKAFLCQELGCGGMYARKDRLKDHMCSAHGAP